MRYGCVAVLLLASTCCSIAEADDAMTQVAGRTLDEWADDLGSDNHIVQLRAAKTLPVFGAPAVPLLVDALDHQTQGVRYWAASGIGDLAVPHDEAPAKLHKMLKENSVGLQIASAYALCRLGELDAGLPVLTEALEHPIRGTANSAADFLARIGPPAKEAIPALEQATQHNDYHVKGAAMEALRRIRVEPVEE